MTRILDVGSGHQPYPPATILTDLFPKNDIHRGGRILKRDERPFICCSVEALPFKTQSINFVHCSYVLEHISNPELGLQELKRVGKYGYVSVPSSIWEWILGVSWEQHQYIVTKTGKKGLPVSRLKPFSKLKRFWQFNLRIRLRERLGLQRGGRGRFLLETRIRW